MVYDYISWPYRRASKLSLILCMLTGLTLCSILTPRRSIFLCCSPKSRKASLARGCGSLTAIVANTSPIPRIACISSEYAYKNNKNALTFNWWTNNSYICINVYINRIKFHKHCPVNIYNLSVFIIN